jgi:hypothetical protein
MSTEEQERLSPQRLPKKKKEDYESEDDSEDDDNTSEEEYDSSDEDDDDSVEYIDSTQNSMYQIMSVFLESSDPDNRINICDAVVDLKKSVDNVAKHLETLVLSMSEQKTTVL